MPASHHNLTQHGVTQHPTTCQPSWRPPTTTNQPMMTIGGGAQAKTLVLLALAGGTDWGGVGTFLERGNTDRDRSASACHSLGHSAKVLAETGQRSGMLATGLCSGLQCVALPRRCGDPRPSQARCPAGSRHRDVFFLACSWSGGEKAGRDAAIVAWLDLAFPWYWVGGGLGWGGGSWVWGVEGFGVGLGGGGWLGGLWVVVGSLWGHDV